MSHVESFWKDPKALGILEEQEERQDSVTRLRGKLHDGSFCPKSRSYKSISKKF